VHDLVVIGAGVWGAAAGLSAVEAGAKDVLLLEARPGPGGGMSAKSGGIVSQLLAHPDDRAWVVRSRELFEDALVRGGDSTMIERTGSLALCTYDEAQILDRIADELRPHGVEVEVWDRSAIQAHYPLLGGVEAGVYGMWSPTDWHVNPTAYADATVAYARSRGLQVRFGCPVTGLRLEDDRVVLTCAGSAEPIEAARVLIAAGVWTRQLTRLAGIDIAMIPYRVQLASLAFPHRYALPILSETGSDVYITPDGPANLLAGDGTQLWEHDPEAYNEAGDRAFEEEIATAVTRLIPSAHTAELRRSWAGLCGGTPGRRPLIGGVAERLFVACGGNGFGIKRGPAIGELAARMALGLAAPNADADPLRTAPADFVLKPGSGGRLPS
jgi:glycine/D-amino acid oxidase-like deaminating enzyme